MNFDRLAISLLTELAVQVIVVFSREGDRGIGNSSEWCCLESIQAEVAIDRGDLSSPETSKGVFIEKRTVKLLDQRRIVVKQGVDVE